MLFFYESTLQISYAVCISLAGKHSDNVDNVLLTIWKVASHHATLLFLYVAIIGLTM